MDERPPTRAELTRIHEYAKQAAADPTHGVAVPQNDQKLLRRICNPLLLGELVDHRYVLDIGTCHWSRHLLQEAAKRNYRDHFPVHVLRELLDLPKPRGFDRELQNLIIAVFALEQQLSWYADGRRVSVLSPTGVDDRYELRHPPMPEPDDWKTAVEFGQPFFGEVLPIFRSPANLTDLATPIRTVAGRYATAARGLVTALHRHADTLGLDPGAGTGRLATAGRVADLLTDLERETDDVVLVTTVARAAGELHGVGVAAEAARRVYRQAQQTTDALNGVQWSLLEAITKQADTDERARDVLDRLRTAARHDHHAADLVAALREAVNSAATLLAAARPTRVADPDVQGRTDGGGDGRTYPYGDGPTDGGGRTVPGGTGPVVRVPQPGPGTTVPPGGGPTRVPPVVGHGTTADDGRSPGGGAGGPTVVAEPVARPGDVDPARTTVVADRAGLDDLAARIAAELAAGRRVRVTWTAEPGDRR